MGKRWYTIMMFIPMVLGILYLAEGNYDAALPWFLLVWWVGISYKESLVTADWKRKFIHEQMKRGR